MFSRLGAINKIERRAARGLSTAGADMNIARITAMNNPMALVPKQDVLNAARLNMRGTLGGPASTAAERLASARATLGTPEAMAARFESGGLNALGASLVGAEGATAVSVGARRYAMTEGVQGSASRSFMRGILTSGGGVEMRTGMGTAGMRTIGTSSIQMTDSFFKIANPLTKAFENSSVLRSRAAGAGIRMSAISGYEGMATEVVEKGILKSLGTRGAMSAVKHGGARVGMAVAGEAALAAIPGLNLIFAADMAYQLAKLGGKAIKGGINFGKDAMKSMQGNMYTGVFGAGYKDDEVRATSRSRGVAAIQNSRLNARSLLGSEGAMMASHFG